VIAVGAVAAAIGAILALWPNPTPELGADISDVEIDTNVTLSEYALRHETASASAPNGTAALHLAGDLSAQTATQHTTTTTGQTTTGQTTTGQTTTRQTTTGQTTTGQTTTGGTTTTEHGKVRPLLRHKAQVRLSEGVRRALSDPAVAAVPMVIGPACSRNLNDPDCGLGSAEVYVKVFDEDGSPVKVDPATIARRLAKLLADTRKVPSAGGQVQPVGVTVNYKVSLTGFRGRRVNVRWSLYSAASGVQVPHDWLRNQPVHWLKGEAEKDSTSDSFWVPLPKIAGPFFVRVGVYNEDDARLDYADTRAIP
jgi:hypothetical protein